MKRLIVGRLPWPERARIYSTGGDGLRALLVKGASGTFALKVFAAGVGFLTSLLLARLLGAAGYGAYAYALSWISLLVVPAALGLDSLLVRNVAAYRAKADWGSVKGLWRWANRAALVSSVALAVSGSAIYWFLGDSDPQMLFAFLVAMISLPMVALIYLRQGAMRGLQRVVTGYLPENLVRPLLLAVLVGGAFLLFGGGFLSASWAVGLYVVATAVALVFGAWTLRKALPLEMERAEPVYRGREWSRSIVPLVFLGGMLAINNQTSTVLLGVMASPEETGVYAVVNRGVSLIMFVMTAANVALAPAISRLHASGDLGRLQRMVTKSTRLVTLASLPLALGFILFNYWILLIFGEEFTRGGTAMAIFGVGYLLNAAIGSVGILLVMTHHERDAAVANGVGAGLNVALNAALIPIWGIEGAAVATVTSLLVWDVLALILVYRRLGIDASALGKIGS